MFSGIPSYLRKLKGLVSTKEQIDAAVAKANSIQDVNSVVAGLTATSAELNAGVLTDKQNAIKNLYQVDIEIGLNKLPIDLITQQVGSINSSGVYSATGTNIVTGFFEVKPSQIYSFSGVVNLVSVAQYDSNFNFISKASCTYGTTFTTASNCKYFRLEMYSGTLYSTMLIEGAYIGNIAYVPFSMTIKDAYLNNSLLLNDKRAIKKQYGINLIDKTLSYTLNAMINSTTGIFGINAGWSYSTTDYQPFDYGGQVVALASFGVTLIVSEYDKNKKFIQQRNMYNNTYTIHTDTKFVRYTYGLTNGQHDLSKACMVLGSIKPDAIYDSKNGIKGTEIENRVYLEQELAIPSTIYGYQYKQLNVYHNHLLKENNRKDTQVILSNFNWNKDYSRNVWSTVQVGTSFTASLYDRDFVLQDQKTLTLKVGSSTNNTGNIVASILGDSYTSPAFYTKRIKDLVPNFTSVGVCRGHSSLSPMLYTEGRAGWTLKQYFTTIHSPAEWAGFSPFMQPSTTHKYYGCTKAVIATLNASPNDMYDKFIEIGFNSTTGLKTTPNVNDVMYVYAESAYKTWNGSAWVVITEAELGFTFNFAKYRDVWNIAQPNYFMVNLGVNDFSTTHPMRVKPDVWDVYFKSYLDLVIASVKVDNPTIKIGVMIPNGKFGDANVITGQNFIAKKDRAMFEARKLFIANYDNRTAENIYLLDPCSAIDSVNGMGNITTVVPFEEYTGTPNVLVTDDPIHPNGYAYNAMAVPLAGWIQSTRG